MDYSHKFLAKIRLLGFLITLISLIEGTPHLRLRILGGNEVPAPVYSVPLNTDGPRVEISHFSFYGFEQGARQCGKISCWYSMNRDFNRIREQVEKSRERGAISVALYNLHHWGRQNPASCQINATLSMGESWESMSRFGLHYSYMPNYNGNTSTHPSTTIPSAYVYFMKSFERDAFIRTPVPFHALKKRVAFVNSNCKVIMYRPTRDETVAELRQLGITVDGLAKCMHTPELAKLIVASKKKDWTTKKVNVTHEYAFTMAFENAAEPGYVSEKVIHPLLAGKLSKFACAHCVMHIIC